MSQKESNIVTAIICHATDMGHRLFRNVRGMFLTQDGKRKVIAGLQPNGASDAIGFTKVRIGTRDVAVYTAIEVKTDTGRPSQEQIAYIEFVKKSGGIAGVARSPEDYEKIVSAWLIDRA